MTATNEYLAVVEGVNASSLNYFDIASTSTGSLTLTGTSGNDTLLGGLDNDIIFTGSGMDSVFATLGNDIITIDGMGSKVINGGEGIDSLNIQIAGVESLSDFDFSFVKMMIFHRHPRENAEIVRKIVANILKICPKKSIP